MDLSDVFSAVAYKELVQVDLPGGSHQHELNGSAALRSLFGTQDTVVGRISWRYFTDDQGTCRDDDQFKWYDARARGRERTKRSAEWRFYYYGEFLRRARPGDLLILARPREQQADLASVYGLVFPAESSVAQQAAALFGLAQESDELTALSSGDLATRPLELFRSGLLTELDIDVAVPTNPADQELVLDRFGRAFPSTTAMSELAREASDVSGLDADETLVQWLHREEQLFRSLEEAIESPRIARRFTSIDEFIEYSKAVANRRKVRMGRAFENHLGELFRSRGLRFTHNAVTEGSSRPDFLFPGRQEYHDPSFSENDLLMLGAKSTCKDRWRQVLVEADRIRVKHLCTLQTGISPAQTDEMARQRVHLVVPRRYHDTFTAVQQRRLLTLEAFIAEVRAHQAQ